MIPVVWLSLNETPPRCRWDQDFSTWFLPEDRFAHFTDRGGFETWDIPGAVVVYPAGENADQLDQLNAYLHQFAWVVLILTSDECSTFPVHDIRHHRIRIYVQSPRPGRHIAPHIRYIPVGAPAFDWSTFPPDRQQPYSVGFRGQVTHAGREAMMNAFRGWTHSYLEATEGFTQGLDRNSYCEELAATKVILAPSGPCSADTFRVWEALEAGCIPIVDDGPIPDPLGRTDASYPRGFWSLLLGEDRCPPFPAVDSWEQAPDVAESVLSDWPASANRVSAWYQGWKRNLRLRLIDDVAEVSDAEQGWEPDDITVLVPTSPCVLNPDHSHLETVITSIRERLPSAEILLMLDGVRPEQEKFRADYEEYQRRVLWCCNHVWTGVTPFRFDEHLHQVEMMRRVLPEVRSPFVLFVEHDTPLVGDIPFGEWVDILRSEPFDIIRTYPETVLQPEHQHLMDGRFGRYIRTRQFSARPHLARTEWYRYILRDYFTPEARTFVEDKLHSVAQDDPGRVRILIYAPDGNIQRSTHLDARGNEEKFESLLRF